MLPLPSLSLELVEHAFHPLLGSDESVLALGPSGFGHQHLVPGLHQLAYVLERDQTVDPMSGLIRAGREEIETATEQLPQPLLGRRYDRNEEAFRTLVHHASHNEGARSPDRRRSVHNCE